MFVKAIHLIHRLVPKLQYRQKIMIVLLIFTLIPLMFGGFVAFRIYMDYKMGSLMSEQKELLKKPVGSVDLLYQTSLQKLVFLTNNMSLLQMLREDFRFDLSAYLDKIKHANDIIEALNPDPTKGKIIIYGMNETLYSSEYVKKADLLEPEILREMSELAYASFLWKLVRNADGETYDVRLFGKIMDLDRILAITEIRIPFDSVAAMFDYPVPYDGFIIYMNDRHAIPVNFSSAKGADISKELNLYEHTGHTSHYRTLEVTVDANGDKAVLFLNAKKMFAQYMLLLVLPLVMMAVLITAVYFSVKAVSFLLTKRLARLMKNISIRMEQAAETDLPEAIGDDEFSVIDRRFREMVREIKQHYRQVSEYELQSRLLEMEILQVNINPHFLYNTLSAIKWSYPDARLSEIIDSLVVYYRIFLNKGENTLPLFRELEMIRMYMDLQKFAYQSDMQYEIDFPEDILQQPIIKNLIQPIVENGIIHGINGLESGGRIRLSGKVAVGMLVLEITDNGVGMSQDKVDQLMHEDPASRADDPYALRGYGIYNVFQRIRLYYGEQASLHLSSRLGEGSTAVIMLPLKQQTYEAGQSA